ncbi:MAG TPA: HAD family phosphatase [Gaiellaceae bacterium]
MKYRAVVFDLWNTLVLWPSGDGRNFYGEMADHVGVQHERFGEAWTAAYDDRAVGPLEPTVRTVCEHLELAEEHVDRLISFRIDFTRKALVPREGALEVLLELRRRGLKLGLISVCSEEVPRLWEETPLAPAIDVPVFSCSVGVRKPESRIYEIAAERLGLRTGDCLFVDDQPEFVEGAVAAGMDAVLIASPAGAPEPLGDWHGPRISSLDEVLELAQ